MVDDGVYFDDVKSSLVMSWKYNKSVSSVADMCSIILASADGAGIDDAGKFSDIKIYPSADSLEWRGEVYDVIPHRNGTIEIIGYGYIRALMTRFHIGTFTGQARSAIVESLIDTYGGGITTISGITATGDSITRTYKSMSIFDIIVELANEVNYDCWVEDDLDFHFGPRGSVATGETLTLTGGRIISVDVPSEGRNIYNYVKVCGDANQDGICETHVIVEDKGSQSYYSKKREYPVIVDKSLRSVAECKARGQQIIDELAWEVKTATIEVFSYGNSDPGETIILSGFNTRYGIEDGTYLILERSSEQKRSTQVFSLAQYTTATQDAIAELIRKMRKQEYDSIDATATPTHYLQFYEDVNLQGYTFVIYQITIGTSMIAGHPTNGYAGNTGTGITAGRQGTVKTTHYSGSG